ncbi:MAG: cysteine hydrolase [Atopobiaceae bacterium]|nr:cysteine hydrolase [Atopobiaceae bacterium]MDO4403973.1 isochorismatase family cysteine hydrolase [Atopobiaceae bacterium]
MSIDKQTTALLVIDVLTAAGDDAVYEPQPDEALFNERCVRITRAAREAGLPVIFANDDHIEGVDKELELWGPHGIHGKVTNLPELEAGSGTRDFIVTKRRYSAFFGTDLDLLLRELGVTTLIAVGEDTNICVLHTLADAYYLGYKTIVPQDATRTFLCGTQEAGIEHFVKCFGSTITTVDEMVAQLSE